MMLWDCVRKLKFSEIHRHMENLQRPLAWSQEMKLTLMPWGCKATVLPTRLPINELYLSLRRLTEDGSVPPQDGAIKQ